MIAIKDTGTVSVNENNSEIKDYKLLQNYPNPFNPTTKITYALQGDSKEQIKVYSILGKEIAELVNENKTGRIL